MYKHLRGGVILSFSLLLAANLQSALGSTDLPVAQPDTETTATIASATAPRSSVLLTSQELQERKEKIEVLLFLSEREAKLKSVDATLAKLKARDPKFNVDGYFNQAINQLRSHNVPTTNVMYAVTYGNFGSIYFMLGEYNKAEALLDWSVSSFKNSALRKYSDERINRMFNRTLIVQAQTHFRTGKPSAKAELTYCLNHSPISTYGSERQGLLLALAENSVQESSMKQAKFWISKYKQEAEIVKHQPRQKAEEVWVNANSD
jgi:hypothetical protein